VRRRRDFLRIALEILSHSGAPRSLRLTAGATARLVLRIARGALSTIDKVEDWIGDAVQQRLDARGVSGDRLQPPDRQVYWGVAVGMVAADDVPELRELFANLLAAMDAATARDAHVSFADVIRQLSPDEARILSLCDPSVPLSMDRTVMIVGVDTPKQDLFYIEDRFDFPSVVRGRKSRILVVDLRLESMGEDGLHGKQARAHTRFVACAFQRCLKHWDTVGVDDCLQKAGPASCGKRLGIPPWAITR